MGIEKIRTSPYHAQTNEQVEQAQPNADAHETETDTCL